MPQHKANFRETSFLYKSKVNTYLKENISELFCEVWHGSVNDSGPTL